MKYPIGIQTFEKIRTNDYVYVDKTALVYRLCHENGYYFLSRPRRFGKSLLLSTMHAYFSGQRELFRGLAIDRLETNWTPSPVLHLDLNGGKYTSVENLRNLLALHLNKWEELYGTGKDEKEPSERFNGIIRRAYEKTGQKVAILVDEYDKPLLQTIDNLALQDEMRTELKAFFSQLKTQDPYIRFAFLTGVTKFSKVSIFSDLNNISDISLDRQYETLCGISKEELRTTLKASVKEMANEYNVDEETMFSLLQKKYDGYHFSKQKTDIFNPFSLLMAFHKKELGSYWFESGTPTFLIKLIKSNNIAIDSLDGMMMNDKDLGKVDDMKRNPKPVLYQSGYLTITDYDREEDIYTLGFPNQEVTDGFFNFLLPYYANVGESDVSSTIYRMRKALKSDDIDTFLLIMQSFFAGYDYSMVQKKNLEEHYHNVIYTVCKLIGLRVKTEYHTSNGRIDILLETDNSVFIFEFKLNLNSKKALQQIKEKDYAAQFAADNRKIFKVGVNFDSAIRGIKDWQILE